MKNYKSLDEALSDLEKKGYENDFTTASPCLYCSDLDMRLDPQDFYVDEIDRIEENPDTGYSATLYAISSSVGVKGTIVESANDTH